MPERIWIDSAMQPWRVWTIELSNLPQYTRTDIADAQTATAIASEKARASDLAVKLAVATSMLVLWQKAWKNGTNGEMLIVFEASQSAIAKIGYDK